MFTPETFGEYEYTFIPENKVAGHEVDYDNEEEMLRTWLRRL